MKIKYLLFTVLMAITCTASATRWFVNATTGDDTFDGLSDTVGTGGIGPKKTIGSAISFASSYDTILVSEGVYEEILSINKPLVIWGNNFGVDPNVQTRRAESVIISPSANLGSGISGNSLIEIMSCCIELDGFLLTGDNPKITSVPGKYGKEFEISYGIGGQGNFGSLLFQNLILTHFQNSGIHMVGGATAVSGNKFSKCLIRSGEQNSKAVFLKKNFYANIDKMVLDSVGTGMHLDSFSARTGQNITLTFLDIKSESNGLYLSNFSGSTDLINFEYNNLSAMDATLPFNGIYGWNLKSTGTLNLIANTVKDALNGVRISNWSTAITLNLTDLNLNNGTNGLVFEQPSGAPVLSLTVRKNKISDMTGNAIAMLSEGGLLTLNLQDVEISNALNGIQVKGSSYVSPTNTRFTKIAGYYFYLDTSAGGKSPVTKTDGTQCMYDGVLGYNLNNRQPYAAEDKIRHYLDRPYLGWVLFKYNSLYITGNDGNTLVTPAIKVALAGWNLYVDSIAGNENVTIDKTLHLYTHKATALGRLAMNGSASSLFLHGKLYLRGGMDLKNGVIEVTDADTLMVQRSATGTQLSPGSATSYVKGTLYVRYSGFTAAQSFLDTFPIGKLTQYRPLILNAEWPSGLSSFDLAVKMSPGKAPLKSLPAGITHYSDIRYWELLNPFNQKPITMKNVGMFYGTTVNNDLVNDPINLRVLYDNKSNTFDLGGNGTAANTGSITSGSGSPGFGFYTFGNLAGGNNMLSATRVISLVSASGKCINDTAEMTAELSRSFAPISRYEWKISGPTGIVSNENAAKIRKLLPVAGRYVITVVVTNNLGNTDTASTDLEIFQTPNVQYTKKLPCFPIPVELTNTSILPAGTSISKTQWNINSALFNTTNLSYSAPAAGSYSGFLKVTLNTGCFDSAFVSFISPAAPSVKLTPNDLVSICDGDSLFVKVSKSAGLLVWNDGNNHDSFNIKTNAFYHATIYATPECFRKDSIRVRILPLPTVDAGPDFTVLPGKPVTLKGKSDAMVEWTPVTWLDDPLIPNPVSRPLNTIQYVLRAYNTDGCELTDTVDVFVDTDDKQNVPNLLTPNGDGQNDKWVLSNFKDPENCSVDIFNREGQNVFSSLSYENDFDGTKNGTTLNDGYYVYVIEHKPTGKKYTGILTILK